MSDSTTSFVQSQVDWLAVTIEDSVPDEWMVIVSDCVREIESHHRKKHPDLIEVLFQNARGKLQISTETSPPVPWLANFALHEIVRKYQALANEVSFPDDGVHWSSFPKFQKCSTAVEQAVGPADTSESMDEGKSIALHPDIDFDAQGRDVCGKRGHGLQFQVFRGLSNEDSLEEANAGRDEDTSKRLKITMRRLRERGPARTLQYPNLDWKERLDRLEQEFPNFHAVIETIIRPHLGLLSLGKLHRMVPTLLIGGPGVGKTQFARELESIMGVPALFLNAAEETNGSGLSGSSVFWSNSSPGRLFELMAWGCRGRDPVANPVVILDEVDKVADTRYDPLAALYTLLESETAARFEDQAVIGVSLDLSQARFLLTANDEDAIPLPLLSRVRIFHIEPPDADGMKKIAHRMYVSFLKKHDLDLSPDLPSSVLNEISEIGPRESKVRLEAAIAIAVTDCKSELDLNSWRKTDCGSRKVVRKMGFL